MKYFRILLTKFLTKMMVKFKSDSIQHWIYSSDKKSKLDKVQSFDSLKEKLSGVAKM